MKRFAWTLQRLLDVTQRREQALRGELTELSGRIGALRREAAQRRDALRRQMEALGRLPLSQRMERMVSFAPCVKVEEAAISALQEQAQALQEQRRKTMEKFLAVRASRRTLEKLRTQSYERYKVEARKAEQKLLDETATVAFARQLQGRRAV